MSEPYAAQNDYSDETILAILREALCKILVSGQEYQLNLGGGTRLLTRADLAEVRSMISEYELRVDRANGPAVSYVRLSRG